MGDLSAPDSGDNALAYYEAGLADLQKAGFETSPEASELLAAIAELKCSQNDFKTAARYLEKSCAILDKIKYSENDHAHAVHLYRLAFVYRQLDKDDEAIAADEKAKRFEMSGVNYRVGKIPKF